MKFEDISKKVKKFSKDTVEEVQKMNEVRQLNGRISDTKKQISSVYLEIGKKLYDMYKEAPLEGFEAEIRSIDEKIEQIQKLQDQVRSVKGVVLCPCCNMEVSVTERFCSNCGNKMPELVEIAEADEAAVVVEATDVTEESTEAEEAEEKVEAAEEEAEEAEEKVEAAEAEVEEAEEKVEAAETEAEEAGEKVEAE